MLVFNEATVKEAILVLLIAIAVFLCLRSPSEPRQTPAAVAPAPVNSTGRVVIAPVTSNSLSDRWKTGPGAQANITLAVSDRWQMVPNGKASITPGVPGRWNEVPSQSAQASVTSGVPGRWKTGPNSQTDLSASPPPDRWKPTRN